MPTLCIYSYDLYRSPVSVIFYFFKIQYSNAKVVKILLSCHIAHKKYTFKNEGMGYELERHYVKHQKQLQLNQIIANT